MNLRDHDCAIDAATQYLSVAKGGFGSTAGRSCGATDQSRARRDQLAEVINLLTEVTKFNSTI